MSSSASPLTCLPDDSLPSSDREITHHLLSFPDEACAHVDMNEALTHVSKLLPQEGLVVLVAAHDLIDDVNGIRRVTEKTGNKKVYALTSVPVIRGEMFCHSITWAKKFGHADTVLFCRHELSVLLGVEAGRGQMRNGIVIVKDGKIVWSKVADARRPSAPHEIDAFVEAFDYHNR